MSLEEASGPPEVTHRPRLPFRAIATGTDPSDLGYGPGEKAERLMPQSADAKNTFDPVFIAGLPSETRDAPKEELARAE